MSSLPQSTGSDTFYGRFFGASLAESDPDLARAIGEELARQQDQIELIASENIVSRGGAGSPGLGADQQIRRGLSRPALLWRLRVRRCCRDSWRSTAPRQLFDCAFANVQPHSGAQANQAVFMALLQPGDTILGMSPGRRRSPDPRRAGQPVRQVVQAPSSTACAARTRLIDFDEVEALAREHKPKLIIAGGSAYPRIIDFARFRKIADEVGAYFMVDMAHFAGLVAGGVYPSPAAARPCRHDHDAQDAARPARRHDPVERRRSRQEDQLGRLPRPAGRAADACHRRQGRGVRRGAAAGVQDLRASRSSTTPRRWPTTLIEGGLDIVSGGTDSHLMLVDLRPKKRDGQGDREGARARRHHLQQERHSVRSGKADGHLGRPSGHRRPARRAASASRSSAGRPADRRSARRPGRQQLGRQHRRRSPGRGARRRRCAARFPIYPTTCEATGPDALSVLRTRRYPGEGQPPDRGQLGHPPPAFLPAAARASPPSSACSCAS